MKIYLVGGAVRDKLLGRPIQDRDFVVVGATPEELLALGYKPVGGDFPVFLHPKTREEYALARTERKSGRGYKGFTFHAAPDVTLEDDLRRRDLTINAIAEDERGHLIDPFGGARDLADGILRHVSPAFAEDPLRVLRVARFAARFDFRVADETLALMREVSAGGELLELAPERVWMEFERALGEAKPRRFIEVLREAGALEALFPEIDRLFGVPQPEEHHPEIDTGVHTLMVLDQAARLSPDPEVRFAALLHDLGKGETPRQEWPAHRGHEERGVLLISALCDRYRVPNAYRELAILAGRYHLLCHRANELSSSRLLELLESTDAFRRPDRFEKFLIACEADARGRAGFEDRPYPQAKLLRRSLKAAIDINVNELIERGLSGEKLGEEIRIRRIEQIARLNRHRNGD